MSYPVAIGFPPAPPSREESLAKCQRGVDSVNEMCGDLGNFLVAAFPDAAGCARTFTQSLALYLNHNTLEYMEGIRNPPAMPAGYPAFDPIDHLASLCKRRDNLQSQLDAFEEMVEACGGKLGEEGQNMMRAQIVISGIPQELDDLNEEISNFQRQMEAQAK